MERCRLCLLYALGLTSSMEWFEITHEWMSYGWLCSCGCRAGFWNQWLESLQDHCYLCGILLPGSSYDSQGTVVSASTGLGLDWNGHHWSMFRISSKSNFQHFGINIFYVRCVWLRGCSGFWISSIVLIHACMFGLPWILLLVSFFQGILKFSWHSFLS